MRKTLLALAAVACVVPALAFAAADPKPDSHFKYCTSADRCPLTFSTNGRGTKIINLTMYQDKCGQFPPLAGHYQRVRVTDGKFSKEGNVENVIGNTVHYEIQGKFKKPRKAVGTYKLSESGCAGDAKPFVARRDGPAQ